MNRIIQRAAGILIALSLTLGLYVPADASSVTAPQAAGSIYYISTTGSDLNNCSQSAPCKSFNKAMSLAQSGDVISFLPGTYNQQLVISKSGITVEGNGAVIDTTTQNGIKVASTAQNVIVRGFTVTRTKSHSIFVEGKFVTIENNTVYHSILENGSLSNGVITCGNGGWGSAIKAERGSANVVIRNNKAYENCGEGIAATMSQNVVIEGNTVWDNKQVNIYVDNSFGVQVLNNRSYCTGKVNNPAGIALGEESYSGWGAQLRDVNIAGNIVEKCATGIIAFGSDVGGTLTNISIDRNTIPSGTSMAISIDHGKCSNVSITNNLVWKTNIWVRCSGAQLTNNTLSTSSSTPVPVSTNTPTATFTASPTLVPPTATNTAMPAPEQPTSTPVATNTPATDPVLPTSTHTAVPPTESAPESLPTASQTAAPTSTPEPLPTFTHTPVPPTSTPTETPLPPSPVPTSTPEPVDEEPEPVEVAPAERIFDDKDAAFVYSDGWENVRRRKAYGGSYKVTRQDGAFVTFTFTGESFSVLYLTGSDFKTIDVYVDDILVGTIKDRGKSRGFHKRWDYSGSLEPGVHTLKLVFNTGRSRNSGGTLDAVIVR